MARDPVTGAVSSAYVDDAHQWFDDMCSKKLAADSDCVQLFVMLATHSSNAVERVERTLRFVDANGITVGHAFWTWLFTALFAGNAPIATIVDVRAQMPPPPPLPAFLFSMLSGDLQTYAAALAKRTLHADRALLTFLVERTGALRRSARL